MQGVNALSLYELINLIRTTSSCNVLPPAGLPRIDEKHTLPEDVHTFYELCGGVSLFEESLWPVVIVPPQEIVAANPVLIGEPALYDISSNWYIIAHDANGEFLTIDCSREHLGRCYDSFFDRHGIPGSCAIIATSFTDLLTRLYENSRVQRQLRRLGQRRQPGPSSHHSYARLRWARSPHALEQFGQQSAGMVPLRCLRCTGAAPLV